MEQSYHKGFSSKGFLGQKCLGNSRHCIYFLETQSDRILMALGISDVKTSVFQILSMKHGPLVSLLKEEEQGDTGSS
jgi:hypothetical protein